MKKLLLLAVMFVVTYRQYIPEESYEGNHIKVPAKFTSEIWKWQEIKTSSFRRAVVIYWEAMDSGMHHVKLEKVTTETVELHPQLRDIQGILNPPKPKADR